MKKTTLTVLTALSLAFAPVIYADNYVVMSKGNNFNSKFTTDIANAGGTIRYLMPDVGIALVSSDDEGFSASAEAIKGIRSVSHDISIEWQQPAVGELLTTEAIEPPFTFDDDFFFDLQWGHAAISAQDAWAKGYRGDGVRVAVLDSGIDADHPDLAPNLNLALSISFVPGEPFDVGILDPGPSFNHGTHVAGTIAAADNGLGTIGVAPEAEIVAVKVLSQFTGSGGFGNILAGMVYAAQIDADVINMSLGASIPRNCTFGTDHFPARDCAELFVAGNRVANFVRQQGTLIIASGGNSARDLNHDQSLKEFPNDLPGVVVISASAPIGWALDPFTNLDHLASYSNFGTSSISFAAPGGDFSLPGNDVCFGPVVIQSCWVFDMVFSTVNGAWSWSAGTSMAAPHATGVAALIIGANGGDMRPAAVIAAMKAGADDLGKPGKDAAYGFGRLNAANSTP